ncbi:MAG: hypothetical protein HKN21_00990, partial [Candidatus Eisenbacteria bacterium]|nr:hypothetical protein [Candidatus Eisenbacteria bacterium]
LGATEAHTSLMADYEGGSLRYGDLKGAVSETVLSFVHRFQERKADFTEDRVREILVEGAAKIRPYAQKKIKDVRERIGLPDLS